MASSGTIIGAKGNDSYGPYLRIDWSIVDVNEVENKSKLELVLKLVSDYSLYFSADKSGNLDGTSFTYTSGFSGTGTKTIKTVSKWIDHNSDGTKSTTINASFNIEVTLGSGYLSKLTASDTVTLNTIARASGFTSFTLSDTSMKVDTGTTINYTLDRQSTKFDQDMKLTYGSRTIISWTTASTGSLTKALSASDVNKIISMTPNGTSGTLKLTMQTMSGNTKIGSPKTINETFSINSGIKPTATGLTTDIAGSGLDKTLGKYIQTMSKVMASFTPTAGYGASIDSSKIVVEKSNGTNSQTISSKSGTTSNAVSGSGIYTVTATVIDSRGRTASSSTTISVEAFTNPKISLFTVRRTSPTSTVEVKLNVSWNSLGGTNKANILLVSVDNNGTPKTLFTSSANTSGSLIATQTYTGQLDSSSYEYKLNVIDDFGRSSSAIVKIGTSFIEFTISKGLGIGVGKVHERGALDIAGQAYLEGTLHLPQNSWRTSANGGGLNANNGDIYGLNGIWFGNDASNDPANNNGEGLIFQRTNTPIGSTSYADWDNFRVYDGTAFLNSRPIGFGDTEIVYTGSGIYLLSTQTVTPSKPLSMCPNGWILVWSRYDGGAVNSFWNFTIVPKAYSGLSNGGSVHCIGGDPTSGGGAVADIGAIYKYLYATNTTITGHDNNKVGASARACLRYVLAF